MRTDDKLENYVVEMGKRMTLSLEKNKLAKVQEIFLELTIAMWHIDTAMKLLIK